MNRSLALVALVPVLLVTVTSTVPDPAGDVAVICVSLLIVKAAEVAPNSTVVAFEKLTPVMTTDVLPVAGPDDVPKDVTLGRIGVQLADATTVPLFAVLVRPEKM